MDKLIIKKEKSMRRAARVRSRLHGTASIPRLSVHISNTHVTAQLIDDDQSKTIAYSTTIGNKSSAGNMSQKAELIGAEIAKKAAKAKVKKVIFDRGPHLYHGRVKALADAARAGGLEF